MCIWIVSVSELKVRVRITNVWTWLLIWFDLLICSKKSKTNYITVKSTYVRPLLQMVAKTAFKICRIWHVSVLCMSVYVLCFCTRVEQHKCECLICVNPGRHVMCEQTRTNVLNFLATSKATELTNSHTDSHGNLKICAATLWTIWNDVMWWHIMTSRLSDSPFLLWSEDSDGSVSLFCDAC